MNVPFVKVNNQQEFERVVDKMQRETGFKAANFRGRFGGGLIVKKDPCHEVAECKVQSQNHLAAYSPDDRIHFHPRGQVVFLGKQEKIQMASPQFSRFWNALHRFMLAGFELDYAWKINGGCRKVSLVEITINSGL